MTLPYSKYTWLVIPMVFASITFSFFRIYKSFIRYCFCHIFTGCTAKNTHFNFSPVLFQRTQLPRIYVWIYGCIPYQYAHSVGILLFLKYYVPLLARHITPLTQKKHLLTVSLPFLVASL